MKKILMILIFMTLFSIHHVSAVNQANYLPVGKNYLDPANFTITNNTIQTVDDFKVEAYTFYTLSMPGYDLLGEGIQVVIGGNELYINGDISNESKCTVTFDQSICTFRTSNTEMALSVLITSPVMSLYYGNYGIELFQLEEGETATTYEEYIEPLTDTSSPEVSGAGAFIMSYENTTGINEIIANHIVVHDEVDGDLSSEIVILSDEYSTNEGIIGEYDVVMSVSDSSNNTTNFVLTIMVKDEIEPIITGPDNVSIEVFDAREIATIISETYVLEDGYDGTLSAVITSDNYTSNKETLGSYDVSFEITDSSLNKATKSITIDVVDTEKPIISGETEITSYLSNPLTLGEIMNGVTYSDNYTDMSTVPKVIMYDDFSSSYLIPGSYTVGIQVKDSSGNIKNVTLSIEVIDDVKPTILGPTSLSYSYTDVPTVEELKELLTASDNVDVLTTSDITVSSDTFSSRTSDIGSYQLTFQLIDSAGNETVHTMTVEGIDDIPPVIYIDQYIVTLDTASTFTEQDALRLLLNNNELAQDDYEITTLKNEYLGNEGNTGMYVYRMQFKNSKGEIYEKDFQINVQETIEEENDIMVRNIIIYISVLVIIGFIYYKKQ